MQAHHVKRNQTNNEQLMRLCKPELGSTLWMSDDKINVTVQDVQKGNQLRQTLAGVRWIQKAVELRH